MRFSFCRNSVFCALFFSFFLIGTICGIFLLRCMLQSDRLWLMTYCSVLSRVSSAGIFPELGFHLTPMLLAAVIYFLPYKDRLFPVLFFFKGCLLSYSFGAFSTLGVPFWDIVLRNVLLLPVFYRLCRLLWHKSPY